MKSLASTRRDAASAGLKFYYTGKPCKNSHDSRRYTSSGACAYCVAKRYMANNKSYYANNAEKIKDRRRKNYAKDKDRVIKQVRDYKQKNAESIKQKRRTPESRQKARSYYHEHRKTDRHLLNKRIRQRMAYDLERRGSRKSAAWTSLVGYTTDQLIRHIEKQFVDGMSWENMGDWHIDHIIPLSSFKYATATDPEFLIAWGLPNLRPMWGQDNLMKSNRITTLL